MRERGICKFYIAHHECTKGKEAEVLGICQHCKKWQKLGRPVRQDNRRRKLDKINKKERYDY